MKQSEKRAYDRPEQRSSNHATPEANRKTKLKPQSKQKYKPKQVYQLQDDDDDLDIFAYLKEDEELD